MNAIEEDAIFLENEALIKLVGQHVVIGWNHHNKWNAGVLSCDGGFPDSERPWSKSGNDFMRPMRWKLDLGTIRAGNRIAGYEPITETYFVTTDVMWWAPVVPKEEERHPRHLEEVQR